MNTDSKQSTIANRNPPGDRWVPVVWGLFFAGQHLSGLCLVEVGVEGVEVFAVEVVLGDSQSLSEKGRL